MHNAKTICASDVMLLASKINNSANTRTCLIDVWMRGEGNSNVKGNSNIKRNCKELPKKRTFTTFLKIKTEKDKFRKEWKPNFCLIFKLLVL